MGKKKQKPYKSINGKFYGFTKKSGEVYPTEVNDKTKALPILTRDHSKRCPDCQARRCLANYATTMPLLVDSKKGLRFYSLCKCRVSGILFYNQMFGLRPVSNHSLCPNCGSGNILLIQRRMLTRMEKTEETGRESASIWSNSNNRIFALFRCKQCIYFGYIIVYINKDDHLDNATFWGIQSTITNMYQKEIRNHIDNGDFIEKTI